MVKKKYHIPEEYLESFKRRRESNPRGVRKPWPKTWTKERKKLFRVWCQRAIDKKYRIDNIDLLRKRDRRYYIKNVERVRERHAKRYKENPERMREHAINCYRRKNERARNGCCDSIDGIFDSAFKTYKRQAKNRGIEFKLDKDIVFELFRGSCCYCGSLPDVRNGIDRVDNDVGYVVGNVISCCWQCNRMKGTFMVNDFINYCIDIYFGWDDERSGTKANERQFSYQEWLKKDSKHEKMLSRKEYNLLLKQPCHYCNHPKNNGIDRVDNDICYVNGNCVSACKCCNRMKWTLDARDFKRIVSKIAMYQSL